MKTGALEGQQLKKISARLRKPRARVTTPIRRGVYLLPSVITSVSLALGFYSIVSSFNGHLELAATLIVVAFFCDGLDGRLARVSNSTSQFGVEYDSLSDVVAFGAAPACLLYVWALKPLRAWGWIVAAAFVICAALRLARFNVLAASADKRRFVGLPVPGAAALVASSVLAYSYLELDLGKMLSVLAVPMALVLAGLMVSSLPYPSFKSLNVNRRASLEMVGAVMIGIGVSVVLPQLSALLASIAYVLSGPVLALASKLGRNRLSSATANRDLAASRSASPKDVVNDPSTGHWLH